MAPKNQKITDAVTRLQSKYGALNVLIKDHWEADAHAIGLSDKSGQYLGYISTISNKEDSFYLALESPSADKDFPCSAAGEFDSLDLNELDNVLAKHLRLIS